MERGWACYLGHSDPKSQDTGGRNKIPSHRSLNGCLELLASITAPSVERAHALHQDGFTHNRYPLMASCGGSVRQCCNAGNGNRQTAVTIAAVVGAILAAALLAGLAGLVFWVRRRRRQDTVRDLSALGALPNVSPEDMISMMLFLICPAAHLLRDQICA